MISKASRKIRSLLDERCSNEAIAKLTGNGFMVNLMQNFGKDFNSYLYDRFHVRILSYSLVAQLLKQPADPHYSGDDLCICDTSAHKFRFVRERDAGTIASLIRKWYQCSNEINLRIFLLFDSKIGSKFLSDKTHVPQALISSARHGHMQISQLGAENRLALENYYMNSSFAQHIRGLHVVLSV